MSRSSMQCLHRANLHLFQSAWCAALRATAHGGRRCEIWMNFTSTLSWFQQSASTMAAPAQKFSMQAHALQESHESGNAGRSFEDASPYLALADLEQDDILHGQQSWWDRSWLEPESAFDLGTVQTLCVGKYRTQWKAATLMKDPISLVHYRKLLSKLRPRTIFDLGTCGGGSALWLADQCRALGLHDTMVVTIDIEDLRPQHVKDYMAQDKNILFLEGDAFDVANLFDGVRECNDSQLSHPWLVCEDCHLDAFPLMTQFRAAGMQEGDYWFFEDTHPHNPDEAGMSALDPEGFRTGSFAKNKYQQLIWAMAAYPIEYTLDASLQVNSILRQTTPAEANLPEIQFIQTPDMVSTEAQMALKHHGLCLLRYAGEKDLSEDECASTVLPTLADACGLVPADYAASGGSDQRDSVGPAAIEVSAFPEGSHIPAHRELLCKPM
eukprot:COSAG05_NODE_2031_length_3669_cov_1.983193_4_plen_439_part_00